MAFLPRNEIFFNLFEKQSALLRSAASELAAAVNEDGADWKTLSAKLAGLEQDTDSVTRETIEVLSRTFITPLDSEDIHAIAVAQDDVVDTLAATVGRWEALGVGALPAEARAIAASLKEMAEANAAVFAGIAKNDIPSATLDKLHAAKDSIVSDVRSAIRELFANPSDPLEVIRMKDLYDGLEAVALCLNRVAHVVQGVMLKNA